jgi:hypothetical protein
MLYKPMLLPLLAQVFLTFLVWFYLFARRIPEILKKNIAVEDLKDRETAHGLMPDSAAASNNLKNLFEMPVLFFAAVLLSLLLMTQDSLMVWLSWGFVGFRAAHSLVHCSYNDVNHRFALYAASCLILLLLWIRLATFILMQ